jgi:branched-chain amino acid transport system ATP-binding protein
MPIDRPALLSVRGVTVRFGGIVALDAVHLDVAPGEICALIGPNGAGKTTLFNAISGLVPRQAGEIRVDGRPLGPWPPHRVAAQGVARTFQHLALFESMSVLDHVMTGAHLRASAGFLASALRLPRAMAEERRLREQALALLDEWRLAPYADRAAGELPLALKKRVELARALAARPRLLMLDEPAAGLHPDELQALAGQLRALRDRHGLTLLLVEHHMGLVMDLSDHVVVLAEGRRIADGSPSQVRRHPDVVAAYLGATADA